MDVELISSQIKLKLKEKGLTQEQFASMMAVSSPTIKRWLKGEGLLLKDLLRMSDLLGLRLSEISLMAEGNAKNQFTYTAEQESVFVKTEGLLAFFDQILKGKSVASLVKTHKLSEKAVSFYLLKLDRIKLIEWQGDYKIKLLVEGEPSWIPGGLLSQTFRTRIIEEHLFNYMNSRENLKIGVYSLSSESYKKINLQYQELMDSIRLLEIRDSKSNQSKKLTTVILGHGQNEIPFLTQIPSTVGSNK